LNPFSKIKEEKIMNNQHKYKLFRDNEQYTLRKEIVEGFTHYYIAYTDDQGETHDEHVTRKEFAAFLRFGKDERGLRGWSERYIERLELSDAEINARALQRTPCMEKGLLDAEQREMQWQAIDDLPEIQRRRLLMYYADGMTLEEIGEVENRAFQVIARSIASAKKNLKLFLA